MRYIWTIAIALTLGLSFAVAAGDAKAELFKLGRQKIGDYTVSTNMRGDPHVVKTVEFDVKLFDKDASKTPPPDPKALRIWIGDENAPADQKVELKKKTTTFGANVNVPQPLAETAKVWVEIDTDAGTTRGSFSLEHDHKH